MEEDLLNTNSIVFVKDDELLEEFNRRFDEVGLKRAVPLLVESKWYDTISKLYIYCLENNFDYVTCYSRFAYPRKNIIDKYNKEFRTFEDEDWGIISYSRTGDISGWYPGNAWDFIKQKGAREISHNIKSINSEYNEYFTIIEANSFGFDAFTVKLDAFPLFLNQISFNQNSPGCALANKQYDGFIKTYHTKDLYFCHYENNKWTYPEYYNRDRTGYIGDPTTNPPEGFEYL